MASNLKVLVDWLRDGNFTGVFDDVTTRVRGGSAGRVSTEQGRDVTNVLPQVIVGHGDLTLDNRDKRLTARNTASPLFGSIKPARPFLLQRIVGGSAGVGGTLQSCFRGRTDDQDVNPDVAGQSVTMGLVDVLGDLRGRKVSSSVGLQSGIRTGAAIDLLLTDVGWTAGRDLDPGVTVMPLWWEEGNDVFESLGRLLSSEGAPALITIGTNGTFIYRDRHHRLLDTVSAVPQAVWRASGIEPVMGVPTTAIDTWQTIVNDVQATIDVRRVLGTQVLWSLDDVVTIAASSSVDVLVQASDPFASFVVPVAGVDYAQVGGTSTVTASVVGSQIGPSTIVRYSTGAGTGATIQSLRFRGQPIRVVQQVNISASDATSKADYGTRTLPGSDSIGPWCNPYDAQAIADRIVAERKAPLTQITTRFAVGRTAAGTPSQSNARANGVLGRTFSHRVTVKIPDEFIDEDYFVESVRHEVAGEEDHSVTVVLEEAPPAFGPTGSTMFRFDTAGQGFNQGLFG